MKLRTLLDVPQDQRRVMTRDEGETFVLCSMTDQNEIDRTAQELLAENATAPTAFRILIGRIALADADMPVRFAPTLFLASLCSNPAQCVMWAHYVATRTWELGRALTVEDLGLRDFPMGFPTDEGCSAIWDAQKGRAHGVAADNLLDTREPWRKPAEQEAA